MLKQNKKILKLMMCGAILFLNIEAHALSNGKTKIVNKSLVGVGDCIKRSIGVAKIPAANLTLSYQIHSLDAITQPVSEAHNLNEFMLKPIESLSGRIYESSDTFVFTSNSKKSELQLCQEFREKILQNYEVRQ